MALNRANNKNIGDSNIFELKNIAGKNLLEINL